MDWVSNPVLRVLKLMKKNDTIERIEEKVSLIKDNTRINITGFFLLGYPEESEEDILKKIGRASCRERV